MSPDISERSFEEAIECGLLQHGPDACTPGTDAGGFREAPTPYGVASSTRWTIPEGVLLAANKSASDFPDFLRPTLTRGFSWTGVYLGAHGGYGWTKSQGLDAKGGFGGGQGGFNYQMGSFVLGLEGDGAWADISQTITSTRRFGIPAFATLDAEALASLRARFGVAVNNVLFYGTAGGGWMHGKITLAALGVSFSGDAWHSGWSAGGGAEWAFMPNVSAKVEYIHYGFDSATYFGRINSGKIDVDTVKLGVNFLFR